MFPAGIVREKHDFARERILTCKGNKIFNDQSIYDNESYHIQRDNSYIIKYKLTLFVYI